jgi:hypothetical protein
VGEIRGRLVATHGHLPIGAHGRDGSALLAAAGCAELLTHSSADVGSASRAPISSRAATDRFWHIIPAIVGRIVDGQVDYVRRVLMSRAGNNRRVWDRRPPSSIHVAASDAPRSDVDKK